ncbi:MAG: maltose alpha-D-glucosyltransferase [Dehalococcoidia bacterium]
MTTKPRPSGSVHSDEQDPLWYKDAVIYQVHVRAFCDSDADGIGDFAGLTQKLDYLQDLGITAVWLLPFYPSPQRDDGYDIADYSGVNPAFGSLKDFQIFLREARKRGLKVITELVLNHTSDEHEWFQRARRSPDGSKWRNYYVWSDSPDAYRSARVIFRDFETSNWAWDPVAHAYYWHRFYSHQPDLNFENPTVQRELLRVVDFWLRAGVDGLRLDAVPYLFEREGTSCENLPETHDFLRKLRRHVDERYTGRMLLAEANQWPDDAAAYFGDGDECHMNFHFPLMPRLFMSVHMEDRFPIIDILSQTPQIPENCQWAMFLRNHDELTLEMVTDEDRDYMYRHYAQDQQARINLGIRRRLAPLLGNNRRRIELMNGLLFSLPGTPVIYYGDEIGMGDNIYLGDRNGVRTPMQWSADRNAGFSRANPQRLYMPIILDPEYHYETVNVEAQQNNSHSLLWWMKRLIALRKRYKALSRGSIEFLYPENRKVLAFTRTSESETVLIIANLSRFSQFVELDLAQHKGATPVELFGRNEFPRIGDQPYFISLGPHSFYWFELKGDGSAESDPQVQSLTVAGDWEQLLTGHMKPLFEAVLPGFLRRQRWFGGKARSMQACRVVDSIPVPSEVNLEARLLLVRIDYIDGEPETYVLPVAFAPHTRRDRPESVVVAVDDAGGDRSGVVYEATADKEFLTTLLDLISRRKKLRGENGTLLAMPSALFPTLRGKGGRIDPWTVRAEQTNTSIAYGEKLILKLVRRPDVGINPDLEMGSFLNRTAPQVSTPRIAGYLEYRQGSSEPSTIGILQEYVRNEGDAWNFTLDSLSNYFEEVMSSCAPDFAPPEAPALPVMHLLELEPTQPVVESLMTYRQSAEQFGRRTGELHVALSRSVDDPAFRPEPMTPFYQRSIYQGMRTSVSRVFPLLQRQLSNLDSETRGLAESVLACEADLIGRFQSLVNQQMTGARIRVHGDYHLGQLLFTGKDFVIIDFEGEPMRPLSERRLKRPPLRDIAGILRSFHYATQVALQNLRAGGLVRQEQLAPLESWGRYWYTWSSAAFLRGYLQEASKVSILPEGPEEFESFLHACLMEKAVYELEYELNNRPDWVYIPLTGLLDLLGPKV